MADAERRERERSASADEQAQLLRERLRSGELNEEALELCAYLGHGPAIDALGRPAPAGEFVPWDRWGDALDGNREAWLAVLHLGCARALEEFVDPEDEQGAQLSTRDELMALRRWSEDGSGALPELSAARFYWRAGGSPHNLMKLAEGLGDGVLYSFYGSEILPELCPRELGQALIVRVLPVASYHPCPMGSEVEYLRARLEEGDLTQVSLHLAAMAGHPAASEVTGQKETSWRRLLAGVEQAAELELLVKLAHAAVRGDRLRNRHEAFPRFRMNSLIRAVPHWTPQRGSVWLPQEFGEEDPALQLKAMLATLDSYDLSPAREASFRVLIEGIADRDPTGIAAGLSQVARLVAKRSKRWREVQPKLRNIVVRFALEPRPYSPT